MKKHQEKKGVVVPIHVQEQLEISVSIVSFWQRRRQAYLIQSAQNRMTKNYIEESNSLGRQVGSMGIGRGNGIKI